MSPTPTTPARVLSVDAFRGFVMLLMMDSALRIGEMARQFPGDEVWETLAFHTDHVAWTGCSLHDLIQPAFSFLVGVSLPFSIATREERGQGFGRMLFHAIWRAALLMFLGIFLRSTFRPITNWTFMDTLTQIGMGYVFLFLLAYSRSQIAMWVTFSVIVIGYWAAFALYPLPPSDFPYTPEKNGGSPATGRFEGFMAHWNKNANAASDFDYWFLNQFPRKVEKRDAKGKVTIVDAPFTHERSGYCTLNFIPTLATMILGVIAGTWLRKDWSHSLRVAVFLIAGVSGLGLGIAAEMLEVCPIVKIIWTPAWVLYSGGWVFIMLAGFYLFTDFIGSALWTFPLLVVGANSIIAYCLYQIYPIRQFIADSFKTHLGQDIFKQLDTEAVRWEPLVTGAVVLATLWLILLWMYRNKIFVRI